jgi:hypothetical protein
MLAEAAGEDGDAKKYSELAEKLMVRYDQRFGRRLRREYGSYSVLWPCRLYPLGEGPGYEQFKDVGAQGLSEWRYFSPATAHQGLYAGNREAGYKTVNLHLDHEQMRGWYVFDEGGLSGSGGWHHLRTTWQHSKERPGDNAARAMPHGWAIAEVWLLMRDCLAFENDNEQVVLLAGIDPEWLRGTRPIGVTGLATYYGKLSFCYEPGKGRAMLKFGGDCRPPGGFVLRLPAGLGANVVWYAQAIEQVGEGDFLIPSTAETVIVVSETIGG